MTKLPSSFFNKIFLVALISAFFLLGSHNFSSVASAAEFSTPSFGGSGGFRSYNLDCGGGSVMTGLIYKSGSWIDAIGIVCRKVSPSSGRLGEEFTRGPKGGVGGTARIRKCVSDGVLGSASAGYGRFVNYLLLGCYNWDANLKRLGSVQKDERVYRQRVVRAGLDCGQFCKRSSKFYCPSGKAAKALRGKYGVYVDSTRFVCDAWDR